MFESQIRLYSVVEASVKVFGLNLSALSPLRNHSIFFYHNDKAYQLFIYLHCSALCEYKNRNTFLTLDCFISSNHRICRVSRKEGRKTEGEEKEYEGVKEDSGAVTSNGRRRRSWSYG